MDYKSTIVADKTLTHSKYLFFFLSIKKYNVALQHTCRSFTNYYHFMIRRAILKTYNKMSNIKKIKSTTKTIIIDN